MRQRHGTSTAPSGGRPSCPSSTCSPSRFHPWQVFTINRTSITDVDVCWLSLCHLLYPPWQEFSKVGIGCVDVFSLMRCKDANALIGGLTPHRNFLCECWSLVAHVQHDMRPQAAGWVTHTTPDASADRTTADAIGDYRCDVTAEAKLPSPARGTPEGAAQRVFVDHMRRLNRARAVLQAAGVRAQSLPDGALCCHCARCGDMISLAVALFHSAASPVSPAVRTPVTPAGVQEPLRLLASLPTV